MSFNGKEGVCMAVNFNSNVSFKQMIPPLTPKTEAGQSVAEAQLAQENLQKTAGLSIDEAEKLQKIVNEAKLPEQEAQQLQKLIAAASISQAAASKGVKLPAAADTPPKEIRKSSGFKQTISNIAKFFTNLGQMTKATVKGLFYGAATGAASVGAFSIFGTIPKALKKASDLTLKEALKHPVKNLSTKGKIVSAVLALGVMTYHIIKGKLNANKKTADIDHKLKTDHRDGKF